jgi:hypothetical protein
MIKKKKYLLKTPKTMNIAMSTRIKSDIKAS